MEPRIDLHGISKGVSDYMTPFWFLNAVRNYRQVVEAMNADKAFCYSKLHGIHEGKPAMCIGSGPSLTPSLPYVKRWKEQTGGIILCGLSNINILIQAGIRPDYFCIYDFRDKHTDPNFGISTAPEGYYKDIPMIISPEYDHDFIKFWLDYGNKVYFHMRGTGGSDESNYVYYLMRLLPMAYVFSPDFEKGKSITSGIFNCGCVANQEIIVASAMGCDPVYLCGVNFGYPMNKAHVKPMIFNGTEWVEVDYIKDFEEKDPTQFESENGVLTDPTCVFYKHATLNLWARTRADLYEASVDNLWGILDLLPKIDLKELTEKGAYHEKVLRKEREDRIDGYRARQEYKPLNWSADEMEIPKEEGAISDGRYKNENAGQIAGGSIG